MGKKGKKGAGKDQAGPSGQPEKTKKDAVKPIPGQSGDPSIEITSKLVPQQQPHGSSKQGHAEPQQQRPLQQARGSQQEQTRTPESSQSQQQQASGPRGSQQQRTQQPRQEGWGSRGTQQQQPQQQGRGSSGSQQQQQGWGSRGSQQQQPQQQGWGSGGSQQQQPQQQVRGPIGFQQQQPQQQGQGPSGSQQQPQQQGWGSRGSQQQQPQQQGWGPRSSQQRQTQQQQQPQQQGWDPQQRPPVRQTSRESSSTSEKSTQSSRKGQQQTDQVAKDMQQLTVSKRGQQSKTGSQPEKKSLVMRSVEMDYNVVQGKADEKSGNWVGSVGSRHEIEVNYIKLDLDKMPNLAYQYDVKFSLEKTSFRPEAFERFRIKVLSQDKVPHFPIAFDGKNIAFAAQKVPTHLLNVGHPIIFIDMATGAEKNVEITINEAGTVELNLLKSYVKTGITDRHIRAVQCVDVVLRNAPAKVSKEVGRAFYVRPNSPEDLGEGFDLWLGLFQALVLGQIPMINIDIAHKGFPRSMNLLDVYTQFGDRNAQEFLKNLQVIYEPPLTWNANKRIYRVSRLVDSANRESFVNEQGQKMTIAEYYQSKNYTLKRPDVPCVLVGTKGIRLPLELCRVQDGQNVRKAGNTQVRNLIKHAATSTVIRKQKIMSLFNSFNYNRNEILRSFNIAIGEQFIKIMARNIDPPKLKYANGQVTPQKGSWRADRFTYLKSAIIQKWAILVNDNRIRDNYVGSFAETIRKEAAKHNMGFNDYVIAKETNINNLPKVFERFKSEGRSIVFVIISGFGNSYSKVKQTAEINYGLLTQCVKANTVERRMDASTIANIFLKVNSKLNGINHMLMPSATIPMISNTNEAIMFLGADVTHPAPDQKLIPSVVGVAGSYDSYAFQYKFSWRLQDPKVEMIGDMEGIMLEQLQNFQKIRNKLPTHIIYYRDGVSNGQFRDLQKIELNAINRACAKFQAYKPQVTCLVVQKRHHTRMFPITPGIVHERDKFKNVLPGTVVDTTITHPGEKQFFLVSHESIQGTAKPTKYCIIRDDSNFTADQLQQMTYYLCHLFTRCNRSVSYPAPAYYAHHVAARGRVYIEGVTINFNNLAREFANRNVDAIIRSNPMFFV